MADYDTANIRKFIIDYFSDEELTTFCYDYFRDIYEEFATGMSKTMKVQRLIEGCDRRGALPNLLTALRAERTELYDAAEFERPVAEVHPEIIIRQRDPRQVFISYAYEDTGFAHRLAADLEAHGWHAWIAPESIRPGEKWAGAINRGLEECGVFVVVSTPEAVQSKWVLTETEVAIELQHKGLLWFIPAQVEICEVPLLWSAYQFVSFLGDYDNGLKALLAELEQKPPPPPPPRQPVWRLLLARLSGLFTAGRRNRRIAAIWVVIVLLVLSTAVYFLVRSMLPGPKLDCTQLIGQHVQIKEGINAWSEHDVMVGDITHIFNHLTTVYVIGGPQPGIISYGTQTHGQWWEVSETPNGKSLGWVWVGQIEGCY